MRSRAAIETGNALCRRLRRAGGTCCAAAALLLTACTASAPLPPAPAAHAGAACASRLDAPAPGALRIDPALSLATIRVYRGGTLARLGHDHVVASRDVFGHVDLRSAKTEICVPLERLTVDEPALRATAGFGTQPSPDEIEATRSNMLGKVLAAERFPVALIRGTRKQGDTALLAVSVTLHGVERSIDVPVKIDTAPGRVTATGGFSLDQSDFGIAPLAILGGALTVRDRVEVDFSIVARQD